MWASFFVFEMCIARLWRTKFYPLFLLFLEFVDQPFGGESDELEALFPNEVLDMVDLCFAALG